MINKLVWKKGCPIPISDLKVITTSYYGFDDKVFLGKIIVNIDVAKKVFKNVFLYQLVDAQDEISLQNIMLVAYNSSFPNINTKFEKKINLVLKKWKNKIPIQVPILTDDFAPVDQFTLNYVF